jgi:hypothetical protein
MASIVDTAVVAGDEGLRQELAQFEPDPDGQGSSEGVVDPAAGPDDAQWIVWSDPQGESAWAATELDQLVTGRAR